MTFNHLQNSFLSDIIKTRKGEGLSPLLAHHHLIACIKAAAATTALITMSAISMAVGFLFGFRFRIVITPLLCLYYIILLAVCQYFFDKNFRKIEFFCKNIDIEL